VFEDNSDLDAAGTAGLAGFVVLHIWETVDAWVVPPNHNQRVRELREKTGDVSLQLSPYDTDSVLLAVRVRF
jgi:hypothetical protein